MEDEVHILCNCSANQTLRQRFFSVAIDKVPFFRILNDLSKFIWLMTCEDTALINALADFVFQCFELRNLETTQ